MNPEPRALVHATAIALGTACEPFGGYLDAAVLLLGPSGAGKSDLALRLIVMGAKLIADDQTALFVRGGRLFAESPPALHGQIEIRGFGIVHMETALPSPVILAVELDTAGTPARLPEPRSLSIPANLFPCEPLLLIALPSFEASTPAKIAAIAHAIANGAVVAGAVLST